MQKFRKILVPVDGSSHSHKAFDYALGLADSQGAHIGLLHCYPRIPMIIGGDAREALVQQSIKEAEKVLAPHAAKLRAIGVEPALIIREGKAGDIIVDEAADGNYDLVVMGSRGLSGLEGLLMGSATHKVLSASRCPVLVVREG